MDTIAPVCYHQIYKWIVRFFLFQKNHKGFFVNRTTLSRFLSYKVSRLRSLLKFRDFAVLLASPNNCHGVSWVSSWLCLVVPVQTIRQMSIAWQTATRRVQIGWSWRPAKLFARASNVVRTVSLNKHFWTKLKDVGGRGCCFILQEDRTRRTDRAVRGSCYHGMST